MFWVSAARNCLLAVRQFIHCCPLHTNLDRGRDHRRLGKRGLNVGTDARERHGALLDVAVLNNEGAVRGGFAGEGEKVSSCSWTRRGFWHGFR